MTTTAHNMKYYTPTVFEAFILSCKAMQTFTEDGSTVHYKTIFNNVYIYEVTQRPDILTGNEKYGGN